MNFIQKITMIGTLREGFFQDAFFAWALDQVSDFEIVFEFEIFFCHFKTFLKTGDIQPFWQMLSPLVPG